MDPCLPYPVPLPARGERGSGGGTREAHCNLWLHQLRSLSPLAGRCPKSRADAAMPGRTLGPEQHNPRLQTANRPKILQQICSEQVIDLVSNVLNSLVSTIGFWHLNELVRSGNTSPEIWRNYRRRSSPRRSCGPFLGKAPLAGRGIG